MSHLYAPGYMRYVDPPTLAEAAQDDCLQPHLCRSSSCWICELPGPMEGF